MIALFVVIIVIKGTHLVLNSLHIFSWIIFIVFIEFVTILLLFCFFGLQTCKS